MDHRSNRVRIEIERLESRTLFSSSYTVVDLGAQAGASLNNHGQVLVRGATMSDSSVYQNGQLIPMSTYAPRLAKHRNALPLFIDDAGDIVGTFYAGHTALVAPPGDHPSARYKVPMTDVFLFDGKHLKDISIGTPEGVAGSGVVAGTTSVLFAPSYGWVGSYKAFLYFHGRRKIISAYGSAISVNANGDCLLNGNQIYMAATNTITTVSHNDSFEGACINDFDEVVGNDYPNGNAVAVNDSGAVVGTTDTLSGSSVFLDTSGSMKDLNSLAPPSETGWTLTGVTSINNSGQILARGVSAPGGPAHQLLLLPIG